MIALPEVGRSLAANEAFGSLEASKALVELMAPVGGEVVEINAQLRENPKRLVKDPYGTWIIKMKLKDPTELATLLSRAEVAALEQRNRNARNRPPKIPPASGRSKPEPLPKTPGPGRARPILSRNRHSSSGAPWRLPCSGRHS